MTARAVIFVPIGQVSRSDQVVQRLSSTIITGLLEPKEQLPNETDLAKMVGASHIIIRKALNTLRANNFIYTVRGRNGGNFVCENIDDKNSALHPFEAISTDYLLDLGKMHCTVINHSVRLASRWMTGVGIARFRGLVEVLRRANSPELITQADMCCLLATAASSYLARLVNQELQVQAERASLVAILHRIDSIHAEITVFYSALADTPTAHDEAESMQSATWIIDTFTYYPIEEELKYNSN